MKKLGVAIITLNEEADLGRCLKSIVDWVDEISVVDSGSNDRTVEIAKEYGAKVVNRKFDNFASQKNFAAGLLNTEWVLAVDADEEIPQQLAKEIRQVIETDKYVGYSMPRRNFILGGEIKHSRWSPDRHIWLWKKKSGRWQGEVHEEVIVQGDVGRLKHAKIHYQDRSIAGFEARNNQYSSLEAERLFKEGIKFSWWRMLRQAIYEFGIRYLYKLGFLDGWRGLVLAVLMAKYKLDVNLKLRRLEESV